MAARGQGSGEWERVTGAERRRWEEGKGVEVMGCAKGEGRGGRGEQIDLAEGGARSEGVG